METDPQGNACIDSGSLSKRQYSREGLSRNETSAVLAFSLPGYTSDEARLSFTPYLDAPVAAALKDYAVAHPHAVTPAAGGLKKIDAWIDPVRSTPQNPVLAPAPQSGWYLVEPQLLEKGSGFFVECPAKVNGAACIRHQKIVGRSVEIAVTDTDLRHWADADVALRIAVQSLLAPCIP